MSTKKLAMKLGLLRKRSKTPSEAKKSLISNQIFSYLIVIDFESTCWKERNNSQEIIEFPAVLLNTSTGEVESEFHAYVQPQEHPILSEFCTELTGITQDQVEAGLPLHICLSRFNRWLQRLRLELGVVFPDKLQTYSAPLPSQKLSTFLTWSDWDLGVCLQYECKRKQLHKPDVLNSWIDLRSTYRLFYNRKPRGLNGALQDLGIQFAGREHSGLDDARNTAGLAARMMRDGCVMRITRSLERTPAVVSAPLRNSTHSADTKEKKTIDEKGNGLASNKPISSKNPLKAPQKQSHPKDITSDTTGHLHPGHGSVKMCQSIISPKTLLSNMTNNTASVTGNASSIVVTNSTWPHNSSTSVLCSTTTSCFSNLPQPNQDSQTGLWDEEEDAELLVETEERCGSYDDVALAGDDGLDETERECDTEYVSDLDSGRYEWGEPHLLPSEKGLVTLECKLRETRNSGHNAQMQKITCDSSMTCKSIKGVSNDKSSESCFALPKAVNWDRYKTGLLNFPQLLGQHKNKTNVLSPLGSKRCVSEKTSGSCAITTRLKPITVKHTEALKSSFTIYTEPTRRSAGVSCPSSSVSLHNPNTVPSSLSANTVSSWARRSSASAAAKGPPKITSPLCSCGRRAKRQLVSNGGPNQGRGFFCCPVRRSGGRGRMQKGCEFFKWESTLIKSSSRAGPAVGASMSLCQINSTFSHPPPNRPQLRKSY
ncbi:ERI1 exoribonuclease 2 [Cololabis saira]|uniref:ERI1 exoribonuclease 2 n=1 Tax=Cololabis saira TaxID=129043 RepID=UPI002AD2E976|nr:ERI1 exoribonuclease 2 [Cololabis saira]